MSNPNIVRNMFNPNIVATFDLETLDLKPTGVVLSLGVVFFDITKVNTFEELVAQGVNLYFDQEEQKALGRTVDDKTLKWWAEQGPEAAECLNNPNQFSGHRLYEALNILYNHIGFQPDRKRTRWFSRGYFDAAFMDNFCASFGLDTMIKYYCWRDVRSYLDGKGIGNNNEKMYKPDGFVAHNSHHDAAFDAYMMQRFANWTPEELAPLIEPKKAR